MDAFESIESLAIEIKKRLNKNPSKKKVIMLYAFNATGKTRLSRVLEGKEDETENINETLCFNAFAEDTFIWDNDKLILYIKKSWITDLIKDEGLDTEIVDNFKNIIGHRLEPDINIEKGEITFKITTRRR